MSEGRWFLHEHPASAVSWATGVVKAVSDDERVSTVVGHMCRYGMNVGGAPVKKGTRWMTNSEEVAKQVGKRCEGRHQHVRLLGGKAKECAIYPP